MSKSSVKAFFTRADANEGTRVPLISPDGSDTGEYMKIRGVDSDAFRFAQNMSRRRMAEFAAKYEAEKRKPSDEEANAFYEAEKRKVLASLVIEWSLEEPCSPENIEMLLKEAPGIADVIDTIAGRRRHFFGKGSDNLKPDSEPNAS